MNNVIKSIVSDASNNNDSNSIKNKAVAYNKNRTLILSSLSPIILLQTKDNDDAEETHDEDANTVLVLTISLIVCIMFSYWIKINNIYYISESGAAILLGMVIGCIARFILDDVSLLSFESEVFFFFLLPPIIFEAGYSLQRQNFFENIGAITLYAVFGTIISTFFVGYPIYLLSTQNIISGIDSSSPIEPLLFGSLLSSVDPVGTLSILSNLQCDNLLYSLVFGESVLNDAISIALFHSFYKHHKLHDNNFKESDIPLVFLSFITLSLLSICVGIGLGLVVSFIYRHTSLYKFPKFETTLLFLFCYLCYATAEVFELSGILALFFHGVILSHYNAYNLSPTSLIASDQIFATLSTVTETIVYFYMGMCVFTGKFHNWNISFTLWTFLLCIIARAMHIFPLTYLANCFRTYDNKIPFSMQVVMWFTGLRGSVAFALSENMPGLHRDTYASATLSICLFTTVVCGGCTERILSIAGLKNNKNGDSKELDNRKQVLPSTSSEISDVEENHSNFNVNFSMIHHMSANLQKGAKGLWRNLDENYLQEWFGGPKNSMANLQNLERGTSGRRILHEKKS